MGALSPRRRFQSHPPATPLSRQLLGAFEKRVANPTAPGVLPNDQIGDPCLGRREVEADAILEVEEAEDAATLLSDESLDVWAEQVGLIHLPGGSLLTGCPHIGAAELGQKGRHRLPIVRGGVPDQHSPTVSDLVKPLRIGRHMCYGVWRMTNLSLLP